jgi:hypothetical protein
LTKQYGHAPQEINLGDRVILLDPQTRKPIAEFKTGAKPGTEKNAPAHLITLSKQFAMSEFIEQAGKDLIARYPKEEQQKALEQFKFLRDMMKDPLNADAAFPALRDALSQKNKKLFDQTFDIYSATLGAGGSATSASAMVEGVKSGRGQIPSSGTKSEIPPSQLPKEKKSILPLEEIGPAVMKQFNGRTKESGNPVKVSEIKDFVYNTYGVPSKLSRSVTDSWVDKQLLTKGQ